MWKDGILRYIVTRPYKPGSTYLKRERTGSVTAGTIETPTQPISDEPLHFPGKVTVFIGPLTYSSAVLFSNVVRATASARWQELAVRLEPASPAECKA